MTDVEYEKQKARVIKYWDKWFKPLGINWWYVDRTWSRAADEDNPECAGKTLSNWEYRTAEIVFFLPVISDLDDDKLEEVVVHEFVHVLSMPLNDFATDERRSITEHTVTTLARSFMWVREAGEKSRKGVKK